MEFIKSEGIATYVCSLGDVNCVLTYHNDERQEWLAQLIFDDLTWYPCGFGDTNEDAVNDAIRRACKKASEMMERAREVARKNNVWIEPDSRDIEIENLIDEVVRLTPGDDKPYRPF